MVVIATPTRDTVQGGFAFDLTQLLKHSPDTQFIISFSSFIANARTDLVNQAIKSGATHMLWLDSDMRFPKDTLERLLAHNKDIIGANYKQRSGKNWTAMKDSKFIEPTKGLQEVDTLGFGCSLIKLSVFTSPLRKLPLPWFAMPYHKDENRLVGEDVYFYTTARNAGFKVWVDHELSKEIKHVGSVEL